MNITHAFLVLLIAAGGPTPSEDGSATDPQAAAYRADVERQARALAANVVASLCSGRCEVFAVEADVRAETRVSNQMPGFESLAHKETRYVVTSLRLQLIVDTALGVAVHQGLVDTLKSAVRGLTPSTEVTVKAIAWAAVKAPEHVPQTVVVTVPGPQPQEPLKSAPQAEAPTDARDEAVHAFANASPWLLGLGVALVALLAGMRRRVEAGAAQRVQAMEAAPPAAMSARHSSVLAAHCRENKTLCAAVIRRALMSEPPETVAGWVDILGDESLALVADCSDLHEAIIALAKSHGRAALDTAKAAALDVMISEERARGWLDERFVCLYALSRDALKHVLSCTTSADKHLVLLLGPADLREFYLANVSGDERVAVVRAALELPSKVTSEQLDALARQLPAMIERATFLTGAERRAGALLQGEIEQSSLAEQAAFLGALSGDDQRWLAIIERHIVTEAHIAKAADAHLEALIVSVRPDALFGFMQSAAAELRARLEGLLPQYLVALWQAEKGATPDAEAVRVARREVFAAYRRHAPLGSPSVDAPQRQTKAAR